MRLMKTISTSLLFILWISAVGAASITPYDAAKHVDERATVCGVVASANFARGARGQPTFLNLDVPFPSQIFTAVIWGEDRAKFGEPEQTLSGKRICVTGLIELYRGTPEIVLRDANQLTVE